MIFLLLLVFLAIFFFLLELTNGPKNVSPLRLRAYNWKNNNQNNQIDITGSIEIINTHKKMEVMIPSIRLKPRLIGGSFNKHINIITEIIPHHPDEETRKDNYWQAYIVKSNKSTHIGINIKLIPNIDLDNYEPPENIWIDLYWINYGPFGRIKRRDGFVLSLKEHSVKTKIEELAFKTNNGIKLLPIKTHLLGTLDDPIDICIKYAKDIIRPGDILTIGETPLAVMQGRYHHPSNIYPGTLSRLLCKFFHPTSSLATACGMQSLINIEGPTRVLISFLVGALLKLIGVKGFFYRLAGEQARLIDDITGTTPPYDQNIVMGPKNPYQVCKDISRSLGIEVSVVDVNDLGRVKILASSNKNTNLILSKALISNPAGNGNEQTPLVLVRSSSLNNQ